MLYRDVIFKSGLVMSKLCCNIPFQVLQTSDILEHNGACNDRSVVILLVFLSSQLVVKRNTVSSKHVVEILAGSS